MNCCNNVKNLRNNQCSKCNSDNSYKRLLEKFQAQHHNDDSLIDTDPYPNKESFSVQVT